MRFTELLAKARLIQSVSSQASPGCVCRGDAEVSSVQADSRRCGAGCCFVAVRGPVADGHVFINQAIAAGASAIVCEDASAVPQGVACGVMQDTRPAPGLLAQAIRGFPAARLVNVGVTGTKGKSTITYLVRAILAAAGHSPALVGTISYETGSRSIEAANTTPGPIELADMMAEMVQGGRTHLVMEVSSHALHQQRVAGIDYSAAVFSNLTGEHLDYHKTMDNYRLAKRILFENLKPGAAAVVNIDDPSGAAMVDAAHAAGARVITYGLSAGCDLMGKVQSSDQHGTRFTIAIDGETWRKTAAAMPPGPVSVNSPLIGRHNMYNSLAAAGACVALGVDWATICSALSADVSVPGRLQRVEVQAPFTVFVDYAHTDDALKNVLSAARPLTGKRLIVLFGCGGNRDTTKRPRMARVAEELADRIVITSDNPRKEQPQAIIDEIVAGLGPAGLDKTTVEPDRRKAIELAIGDAQAGDLVVLAGKGHENYQIVGETKTPFDDLEVAAEAMRARR